MKGKFMQKRKLGTNGPEVSAIGYGAMGFHLAYGSADEETGLATIRRAYDLGVTFFDTAELYGWGENEKFIGRAVKGFRDDVVLATKFGFTHPRGARTVGHRIFAKLPKTACAIWVLIISMYSTSTGLIRTCRSKMLPVPSRI